MLSTAIDLCKSVIDIVFKNRQIQHDTKLRIAILLEEISKILEDTADKLSKDEYPHFNCALMKKMSHNLYHYIKDVVPEEQSKSLIESLKDASQVEKQFAIRSEKNTIPSIYQAAGEFKALGFLLKS
jgi:hypothetical protein